MIKKHSIKVVLLVLLSTLFAAIMGTCVKYLSDDLNTFMICFYRCLFGLLLIIPFVPKNNFSALKSSAFSFVWGLPGDSFGFLASPLQATLFGPVTFAF